MANTIKIMIVTGEVSGDKHAAGLVQALMEAAPGREFEFFGATGPRLRALGVETIVPADDFAVVGVPEVARVLPMFLHAFRQLKAAAIERRPDTAILVDFPEFNLKLARALKKNGLKVIYYVSPQLWAWRKYRIGAIRKYVDLLITILPFEKQWYLDRGVKHVEFSGNPLAAEVYATIDKKGFCSLHDLDPLRPIIALLPGSRRTEISRILPVMLRSAAKMADETTGVQFIIAAANPRSAVEITGMLADAEGSPIASEMKVLAGCTYDILNAADAAAVTSGTATLEAGLIGTPMAIVYRLGPVSYALFKPLVSVDHIGLINLIAEKRIAAELVQDGFTAETLAGELKRLLEPDVNAAMRRDLQVAADRLGGGGAAAKAADIILNAIGES